MKDWIREVSEFPRPDRIRRDFVPLDGEWEFSFDYLNSGLAAGWHRKPFFHSRIRVPFCVESELSGVGAKMHTGIMWYGRQFDMPEGWLAEGRRVLLHFGAVDYSMRAWLNGNPIGTHRGGFTPFTFDVTPFVQAGDNRLVVRVRDHIDPRIPRGKQSPTGFAAGIVYTPASGIWQSVYLESVGEAYTEHVTVNANPATGTAELTIHIKGEPGKYKVELEAVDPDGGSTKAKAAFQITSSRHTTLTEGLTVKKPKLWSPDSPDIYRLHIKITNEAGKESDRLHTHFGYRTIEVRDGEILLNGEKFYQKLVCAQGFFPRGHYTPPEWDWFERDVQLIRDMGFNGLRMHQKIENPKFLFWCDVLGLVMWEEMPSAWMWSDTMREALREQWAAAVLRDINHPCIITWVPFNESWGVNNLIFSHKPRDFVREIADMTRHMDPTRPVIDNSGFEHVATDILDIHHYLGSVERCREFYAGLRNPENLEFSPANVFQRLNIKKHPTAQLAPGSRYKGQPMIISEYGGFGFYKTDEADKPLLDQVTDYTMAIAEDDLFWGYAYTQFHDTPPENNGLLDYEREPKVEITEIRALNNKVDEIIAARWGVKQKKK